MEVKLVSFLELAKGIIDNRGRSCPTSDEGIPLIATNCIKNDRLFPTYEKIRFVSQEIYDSWFRGHPESGDLIFITKGSPGRVCLAPDPVDFCIAQDMVAVRPDKEKISPKFLFAILRSEHVQKQIEQMHAGTLIPHFRKGDFHELLLPVPERELQDFIGDIYYEFSVNIELNRRMNETLEAIARAIFKSWFVDFDPVRAKADGRQPACMDAETAALFPDSFEGSQIGKIPRGWFVFPLPQVIDFLEGPGIRHWQYTNSDEGTRFLNIRCIQGRNLVLKTANRVFNEEAYSRYRHFLLEEGDIVVSTSGTLGRFAVVRNEHLPLMLNTSIIRMRPIADRCPRSFLFGYIGSELFQTELEMRASGSVQRNFGPMHLKQIEMMIPDADVLKAYSTLTEPILDLFLHNLTENTTLARIRDTLLPKLISGEIRVKDAERFVEEHVG